LQSGYCFENFTTLSIMLKLLDSVELIYRVALDSGVFVEFRGVELTQ
jgi:hypothetical protein